MSNLSVTPSSLESTPDVKQSILQTLRSNGHDLSCLDPSHPSFSSSDQYAILSARLATYPVSVLNTVGL